MTHMISHVRCGEVPNNFAKSSNISSDSQWVVSHLQICRGGFILEKRKKFQKGFFLPEILIKLTNQNWDQERANQKQEKILEMEKVGILSEEINENLEHFLIDL